MNSPKQTEEKSVMDFKEMLRQLVSWMDMGKFGPHVDVGGGIGQDDIDAILHRKSTLRKSFYLNQKAGLIKILIFTQTNEYAIVAKLKSEGTAYLGAVMSCRKPRTGEDWTRGRDLADGKFCRETWIRILADIVSKESVDIQRPIQEYYDSKPDVLVSAMDRYKTSEGLEKDEAE